MEETRKSEEAIRNERNREREREREREIGSDEVR